MTLQNSEMKPLDVVSLRSAIEQSITAAILDGNFSPGDRLVENDIAARLGTSRAPVREALSALEREGIVVQIPRRGYFVVDFSPQDIAEIYSLRLLLEIGALRQIVGRVPKKSLDEMQQLVDELGVAMENRTDCYSISSLDLAFHCHLCRISNHARLCSAWNNLQMQTRMLISVTSPTYYTSPQDARDWHQRILDAIRKENLVVAEAILTEHFQDAEQRAINAFKHLDSQGF